jgi:hypothetical protein
MKAVNRIESRLKSIKRVPSLIRTDIMCEKVVCIDLAWRHTPFISYTDFERARYNLQKDR